jgi:hypothetical protein
MGRLVLFLGLYSCASTAFAPALCVAGVLAHPCESTHEGPCEHESDCTADPCNAVYVRPEFTCRIDLDLEYRLAPMPFKSPPRSDADLEALAAVILLI